MTAEPVTDKARATRDRLARSAGAMFEAEGYGAVSLRGLATENGLTTGAIYGHFRNKADLLAAAIADRITTDLVEPSLGLGEDLPGTLAWQAARYPDRRGLRALLVEGAHAAHVDEEAGQTIGAVLGAQLDQWRTQYRDIQSDGGYEGVDMDALLTLLLAVELGLGVLEATGVGLPAPDTWSATVRRVVEGVEGVARS